MITAGQLGDKHSIASLDGQLKEIIEEREQPTVKVRDSLPKLKGRTRN